MRVIVLLASFTCFFASTGDPTLLQQGVDVGGKVEIGTGVYSLKGGKDRKYCADEVNRVKCNRGSVGGWEKFTFEVQDSDAYGIKGGRSRRYARDDGAEVRMDRNWVAGHERFTLKRHGSDYTLTGGRSRKYCADEHNRIICNRGAVGKWEKFRIDKVNSERRRIMPYWLTVHTCVGFYKKRLPIPDWLVKKFMKLAGRLIDVNFKMCWGKEFGTSVEAAVNLHSSPWSVSGTVRWYKNIFYPDWNNWWTDNRPVVTMVVCYEISITKFTRTKKPLELKCPITGIEFKVDVKVGFVICFGFGIEMDGRKTDLSLILTGGPVIKIGFPAVQKDPLLKGSGTIGGMWTFKDTHFKTDGITFREHGVDVWWQVSLHFLEIPFVNLKGKLIDDGEWQCDDIVYAVTNPRRRSARRRRSRRGRNRR